MKYYKNLTTNNLAVYTNFTPALSEEWLEITEEEYNTIQQSNVPEENENEQIVVNAKKYLSDTDWVISKIDEYKILGKDTSELIKKYADILNKRGQARNSINEYENNKFYNL